MQVAHVTAPMVRAVNHSAKDDMNPGIRMAIAHVRHSGLLTRAEKQSFISSLEGIEDVVGDDPKLLLTMMSVIAMAEAEHQRTDRRNLTTADMEALPLGWSKTEHSAPLADEHPLDPIYDVTA